MRPAAIIVMSVATFSFVFASFYYYCSSVAGRIDDSERALYVYVLFVIRYFPKVQTCGRVQ